jgi:hypothetical protein
MGTLQGVIKKIGDALPAALEAAQNNNYIVTLKNVPVSYWRFDKSKGGKLEFWNSGCNGSHWTFTLQNGQTIGVEHMVHGCGGLAKGSWNWVKSEGLTHIFGDIGSNQSYPQGKLKTDITPSGKVMQAGYNTFIGASDLGDGTGNALQANKPKFESISYSLPDPMKDIDIESKIPLFLSLYAQAGQLDQVQLTKYLKTYLFAKVTGKDGKKYGRVEFINNPNLSKNPDLYNGPDLTTAIQNWKKDNEANFTVEGLNYCSGDTLSLLNGWCYNTCGDKTLLAGQCDTNLTAFCQSSDLSGNFYFNPESQVKVGDPKSKILSKFPNSINPICSAFMTPTYYAAMDLTSTNNDPAAFAIVNQLVSQNFYSNPNCTAIGATAPVHTKSWYDTAGAGCQPITVCLNQLSINNRGNLSSAKIKINQSNDCGAGGGGGGGGGAGSDFFKKHKTAIIIASVVTVLAILLYFFM